MYIRTKKYFSKFFETWNKTPFPMPIYYEGDEMRLSLHEKVAGSQFENLPKRTDVVSTQVGNLPTAPLTERVLRSFTVYVHTEIMT